MEPFIENFILNYASPQTIQGTIMLSVISIWSIIWKVIALWKSARNNERGWFIVVLLVNLAGIVEIAYLFYFAKEKLTIDKIKSNLKSYKIKNPLHPK